MENLLPLLIFGLIAAFSAWLKKRREGEDDSSLPSDGQPSKTPSSRGAWEEEIKKLLGVPPAQPPAPPPIAAPPVYAEPARRKVISTRTPHPATRPVLTRTTHSEPRGVAPPPPWDGGFDSAPAVVQRAIPVPKAPDRYKRPSSRDERMGERLKKVKADLAEQRAGRGAKVLSPSKRALQLLRDPAGTRAAVVASIILGPPKG